MKNIYIALTTEIAKILLTVIVILAALNYGLFYVQANYDLFPKQTPSSFIADFGPYGKYSPYLDIQRNQWTVGLWREGAVYTSEKTIEDLQQDGGVIVFQMPYDGEINNIGGQVLINGEVWKNGNPISNKKGQMIVSKGQKVEIRYEAESPSAGFQIWFSN